ncbi:hypothetical protein EFN57_02940 [Leuconostoc citreum]|uniref:hypothetical protein n=1 Tax=Leuconostoc citreum TaxID=33964 RepID=UPI0021A5FBDF|nr:hypothetical protein [Leuconostoc citreum]MCT3054520.1 hypothetical protein [Leuconostoc citreum]MCT3061949.1 hypothetical protein [Leuconostoc citreum]
MNDQPMHIDPEKFAFKFLEAYHFDFNTQYLEQQAKQELAAYLSAYYLADRFNQIEHQNFNRPAKTDLSHLGFDELLKHVTNLNNY